MDIGVIPQSAEIDRKGRATWVSDDISLVALLERRPDDRLGWHAFAGDAKFGAALSTFGGLSVAIDPVVDDSIDGAEANRLSGAAEDFFRNGIGAARWFVEDRADLASLLASEVDVQRGKLTTWLPRANFPARLVQALIIARDLGLVDLEFRIQQKIKSGTLLLPGGQEVDIAASAKRWAVQYGKVLGFEVPLPIAQ
jgi:hypothetical protein